MKRKGSNQEREYGSAQHHSEEWKEDPVGRVYLYESGDEPFEDEEEEEDADEEEEDEDDLDEDGDLDEDDEEDEEEEDDL